MLSLRFIPGLQNKYSVLPKISHHRTLCKIKALRLSELLRVKAIEEVAQKAAKKVYIGGSGKLDQWQPVK